MIKTSSLIGVFYFSIFFPFVSIYPIGTDLQPIFIILMSLLVVFKKVKFYKKDYPLIIFAFISLIYLNPFYQTFTPFKGLGSYLSIFISLFLILILIRTFNLSLFISVVKKSILFYFVCSIIFLLFPTYFSKFQLIFVRSVNTINEGIGFRGISTFFTEPGLFGGHMIGFLLIIISLFEKKFITKKESLIYGFMTLFMLLASKSGMGYSYLTIVFAYISYKNIKNVKTIIFSSVLLFIVFLNLNLDLLIEANRGLTALLSLSDYQNIQDNSILARLYNLFFGFYILIEYPFGLGFNYTTPILTELINSNQFFRNYYGTIDEYGFVSSLSLLISYYGISIFILLIYIVKTYRTPLFYLFFSLLFLTFSFSAAYPMIWLLLILHYLLNQSKIYN